MSINEAFAYVYYFYLFSFWGGCFVVVYCSEQGLKTLKVRVYNTI